ncbi:MAG: hypothetical protein JNN15_01150, partial [Blastocatellia bacterium]|nr:hypothetical protein [Blastocatellia bacterium]
EQLKRTLEVSVVGGDIIARRSMRLGRYLAFNGRDSDERDFSWTFDIEREIYQRKLKIKENAFLGKIHFNTGIFYTTKLSDEKLKFIAADGSGKSLPILRRIGQPAARIDLDHGQELLISGLAEPLKLKAEYDTNYLVTVYNLPPPEMANLNHFLMYYDIIDEKLTKYEPVAVKQSFTGGGGSMCLPKIFGESGLN